MQMKITENGKRILKYQEDLSLIYKYKPLPCEESIEARREYENNLPAGFSAKKTISFPLYSRQGLKIANGFRRIVIGDYGAFIEIEEIVMDNICVKPGQEFRINDKRYSINIKYHWYTTKDDSDAKLYFQQKGVSYADYKPGMWYISPYEVLDVKEFSNMVCEIQNEKILIKSEEKTKELLEYDENEFT